MAKLQQTSPMSARSVLGVSSAADRGTPASEARPYLVPIQQRKQVQRSLALFPHESEDARLTGETRSLYRRLLALNLPKKAATPAVSSVVTKSVEPVFTSSNFISPKIA